MLKLPLTARTLFKDTYSNNSMRFVVIIYRHTMIDQNTDTS